MPQGMREIADWDLVGRARNGETQAFAELVRRYQTPLIHFCRRLVGSIQEAEDLAQESFIRIYRNLPRLTPKAKFSTVLFGIARNLTLNAIRDAERRGRGKLQSMTCQEDGGEWSVPDTSQGPNRVARLQEIENLIGAALLRLSPEHREVILLRELQDLDYEEIARIIRARKGTVKSRLARAREQLRLRLVELAGGEL